ncbi:hypothetical protein PI125_g5295 [Phytophthora idaei]|nr:hypothetical protein PI125_g5295 [Phytophthora idaei]
MSEVEEKWTEFDSSTVVQVLIRHCPTLEMPPSISKFHALHGVKVYNSTIVDWGDSAAFTSANHPNILSLYLVRVIFYLPDFTQAISRRICLTSSFALQI